MKRTPTIFFFCCEQGRTPEAARYQYGIIPLAEGLTELGIECYSNINYWQSAPDSSDYLFRNDPNVRPNDCDVVVLNDQWFFNGNSIPNGTFEKSRKHVSVYIDCSDGIFTHSFKNEWRAFDVILKAHYNQRVMPMPSNMRPWAFGLTSRIIAATERGEVWENRDNVLLVNFRVEHELRQTAMEIISPIMEKLFIVDFSTDGFAPPVERGALFEWKKTGRRHNPEYYERLKKSEAVSCFGGRYAHRFAQPYILRKSLRRIEQNLPLAFKALYQWDSFRLWEAFSAGCLVFHADLEKEGCVLPIIPQNGVHYIGVDLAHPGNIQEQILDLHPNFGRIADNGREWALANYSPLAIAQRFLSDLGYKQ